MKVVILAGGLGTRIAEETSVKPKPMVEIGGMPILWHIMKHYSAHGFHEFIICLGYKGYIIKEYFANYFLHKSNITIDLQQNKIDVHDTGAEPWKITLVDTGAESMTGGRVKRIQPFTGNESFLLTYGDGVSDVSIRELVAFHRLHGKLCAVTSVQPSGRFGALVLGKDNVVESFTEKPKGDGAWINGGFFVCEPGVFDYINQGDATIWEQQPLMNLSKDGALMAYKHEGYWKPMDTLRDKQELEKEWENGTAPWKTW